MRDILPGFETRRLLLRPFVEADLDDLVQRRNDPAVAEFQNWTLPYTRRDAEILFATEPDGIDGWRMLVMTHKESGTTLGDVAVGLTWDGRCAEVGYTLASEHWGYGYAVEAVEALVEFLFENHNVTRVQGMLHPGNTASARVLERTGFLFEGHTRLSYWVGDDNSDDHIYGMTREAWRTWVERPKNAPAEVALAEINPEMVRSAFALRTHKTQEAFVAPMAVSFADALYPGDDEPWLRSIVADGALAGFVMVGRSPGSEPYLWRLLIDRVHQRRGIGNRALDLVEAACREWGSATVLASYATGRGSPEGFYRNRGYVPTGRVVDGETEARKRL